MDSSKAQQIPAITINGWMDGSSCWYHGSLTMLSSDKKATSWSLRKILWISLNAKTADLWMSTWDELLKSLRQEESSSDRKCYCKATVMNLALEAWRSSIPWLCLERCLKSLMKTKKFSRPQNSHSIILVWGRGRTWCSIHGQIHKMLCAIWRDTWHVRGKCTMTQCLGWWSMLMTQVQRACSKSDKKMEWEQGTRLHH